MPKVKIDKEQEQLNIYMYRYLEKYHGKYRVLSDYDLVTLDWPRDSNGEIDESFDDLYIPCKKGIIRHTYDDYDLLALCFYNKSASVVNKVYDEIKKKHPEVNLRIDEQGRDWFIYFYDKDLDTIADIIKPRTSGARIKWNAKSNKKLMKKNK